MVKNLVLADRVYNITDDERQKKFIISNYLKNLRERTKGFHNTKVKIKKLRDYDKRFEIEIDGPEEFFVYNILTLFCRRALDKMMLFHLP